MNAPTTTAPAVSLLGDEADGIADDLEAIHPAIGRVVDALAELADHARRSPQGTADVLLALAGDGPNLTALLAALTEHLGDPATNPAITQLPTDRQKTVAERTRQYALDHTFNTPHVLVTEAAAAIHGTA